MRNRWNFLKTGFYEGINVVQPVIVGDARGIGGEGLSHLKRAGYGRLPRGRCVGLLLLRAGHLQGERRRQCVKNWAIFSQML